MTFGERLDAYRRFMGIPETHAAHVMADILGISPVTYRSYANGTRTPTYSALLDFQTRLGVSLDWLTGISSHPMWGPDVQNAIPSIRLAAISAADEDHTILDRCLVIIHATAAHIPDLAQRDWFLPGLLGLSLPAYTELISNPDTEHIGVQVVPRLAQFTTIPEAWFKTGGQDLGNLQLGAYEVVFAAFVDAGLTPDEIMAHFSTIQRLIESKRALG